MEISWILRFFITVSRSQAPNEGTQHIIIHNLLCDILRVVSHMFFSGWLTGGDATAFTFPDDMLTFLILFISCLRSFISCLRSFISCLRSFISLKSSAVFTFPDDLSVFFELLILFVRSSIFVVKMQK